MYSINLGQKYVLPNFWDYHINAISVNLGLLIVDSRLLVESHDKQGFFCHVEWIISIITEKVPILVQDRVKKQT